MGSKGKKPAKPSQKQPSNADDEAKQKNASPLSPLIVLFGLCVVVLAMWFHTGGDTSEPEKPGFRPRVKQSASKTPQQSATKTFAAPASFGMTCERRKASELTVEEYLRVYDARKPVIIEGAMEGMGAQRKWSKEWFVKHYGKQRIVMTVSHGPPHAPRAWYGHRVTPCSWCRG